MQNFSVSFLCCVHASSLLDILWQSPPRNPLQARKEAQHINLSLSALADVMAAAASKQSHIPYRNSKLTALLQESLGGDSKTLMLVHCRPTADNLQETICTLNFATRVRAVELGPAKSKSKHTSSGGPPMDRPPQQVKQRPGRGASRT